MKVLKKILKVVSILTALAGIACAIYKVCKWLQRTERYNHRVVFDGKEITYKEDPFSEESVASVFSGVDVDLSEATMKGKEGFLSLYSRFSGVDVTVPKHWRVNAEGTMEGAEVGIHVNEPADPDAPVLNVLYDVKYSGIDINNPKE